MIKERMLKDLLRTGEAAEAAISQGRKLAGQLQPDGTWADLDFESTHLAIWLPMQHLQRAGHGEGLSPGQPG